ncbi:MAG: steroid 3-ketoacyl-CoA thiolase, partial [Acidimicrobiales bacterium]
MPTGLSAAVVVDAVRTPCGARNGCLSTLHAVDLALAPLIALVARTGVDPVLVDDVVLGCATQVGEQSLNIARCAVLGAGWPESIPGTTVDRQGGSGLQALHFAAQGVMAGGYEVAVAGGVEAMSRVPLGSSFMRESGLPFGPRLNARYERSGGLAPRAVAAENVAARWGIGRDELDRFALRSQSLAARASTTGRFADEMLELALATRETGEAPGLRSVDECISKDVTM